MEVDTHGILLIENRFAQTAVDIVVKLTRPRQQGYVLTFHLGRRKLQRVVFLQVLSTVFDTLSTAKVLTELAHEDRKEFLLFGTLS